MLELITGFCFVLCSTFVKINNQSSVSNEIRTSGLTDVPTVIRAGFNSISIFIISSIQEKSLHISQCSGGAWWQLCQSLGINLSY